MFDSLIARMQETGHRFTVYASSAIPSIDDWFANHTVDVDHRVLPTTGPAPFLVVERDGEFVGAIPLETVERLLEPPIVHPACHEGLSPVYRGLFEVLDNTVYTSMNEAELLDVSREIEDRALRVGFGNLHVSFQRLSLFRPQARIYRQLGASGVAVHV
ncbi:MAG: DICT sensory domain-containing protein [Halolamina sp.]